jgi:hypothetical protein
MPQSIEAGSHAYLPWLQITTGREIKLICVDMAVCWSGDDKVVRAVMGMEEITKKIRGR